MNTRPSILVFGGTAEGRMLVEWLDQRDRCDIVACTATEYGASLLCSGRHVNALQGPLTNEQKHTLMTTHDFACIVDATHPYATHISKSIKELAETYGKDVLRIERALSENEHERSAHVKVSTVQEAAEYLAHTTGNILLTTGSKDLACFTETIPHAHERLWVRILPVPESLAQAHKLGIPTDHIVAMQGPFSTQMNAACIREFGIEYLVSKQSGPTGGFEEKQAAAEECGIEMVVIARPQQESGLSLEDIQHELEAHYGV